MRAFQSATYADGNRIGGGRGKSRRSPPGETKIRSTSRGKTSEKPQNRSPRPRQMHASSDGNRVHRKREEEEREIRFNRSFPSLRKEKTVEENTPGRRKHRLIFPSSAVAPAPPPSGGPGGEPSVLSCTLAPPAPSPDPSASFAPREYFIYIFN